MRDAAYERYVSVNLPHARTIAHRLSSTLAALGAAEDATPLALRLEGLEHALRDFDEDPPMSEALAAADRVALVARDVVDAIVESPVRNDRLGQNVRNLFECLGLGEEGRTLSLLCGERPDSALR